MRKSLVISMVLFLGAAVALANSGGGVLKGVVLNAKDEPVAAAQVFLERADGTAPRAVRTDAQGNFRTPRLPAGLYDVRAEAAGKWSEWARKVVLKNGKEAEVTLRIPKESAPKTPK